MVIVGTKTVTHQGSTYQIEQRREQYIIVHDPRHLWDGTNEFLVESRFEGFIPCASRREAEDFIVDALIRENCDYLKFVETGRYVWVGP